MAAKSTKKNLTSKAQSAKPEKPYPDFPLSPHNSGTWQKKIRGKIHYFGRWGKTVNGKLERIPGDGWKEALEIYKAQADDLHAGRTPRASGEGFELKDLCNKFLTSKSLMVGSGELSQRTFAEYRKTTDRLIAMFGSNRLVEDLAADDFERLRADIAKTWGVYRLGDEIQRTRTIFKWAYESGLLDRPARLGPNFKKPSQAIIRKHRATSETKLFTAEEIRTLLAAASPVMKAMILLGINAGFGNTDCSELPQKALDLDRGWVRFDRPKTGVARRAPLWPETVSGRPATKSIRRPRTGNASTSFANPNGSISNLDLTVSLSKGHQMLFPYRSESRSENPEPVQTSGPLNPRCSCRKSKTSKTCEMTMQAYERNDRLFASQNRSVTANSELVLNAGILKWTPVFGPLVKVDF